MQHFHLYKIMFYCWLILHVKALFIRPSKPLWNPAPLQKQCEVAQREACSTFCCVCVVDASCQFLVQRGSWLPPPHPAHLQYHISTLIVTPLPITHVIPHATLPCPCARPAAQKGLENKDRARCHWYHVLMSLEMNNDRAKVYLAKQKELFPKRSLSHTSGKMILCYQISFKKAS